MGTQGIQWVTGMFTLRRSIAEDLDSMLLEVECVCCHHLLTVTLHEVRSGMAIPCPNCEAWLPLLDPDDVLQALYEGARSADARMGLPS